jgi:hypothetical protein
MTLQIRAVREIDAPELRGLVLDNLTALLGKGASPVENMPHIDGCCVATSDAHEGPVLLSFDAVDPQRALLTGLTRMDQLGSEMAALFLGNIPPPAALLVLAPEAPPGLTHFGSQCPVYWRRIQVLSVNGEYGIVIDPLVEETAVAAPAPLERRPTIVEEVLNPREEQYFSQL